MTGIIQQRAIFVGKQFVSIGDVRIDGKEMQFKKIGGFPFLNPFVPILANANEIPYQERNLWVPGIGDTGIKTRIFWADLRLDKFFAMANPQDIMAIKTLERMNEAKDMLIERLFQMLYDSNNEDLWKKRIKKEIEAYNTIKGYGSYGGGFGFGGGFGGSPGFGGGGGGLTPAPEEQSPIY